MKFPKKDLEFLLGNIIFHVKTCLCNCSCEYLTKEKETVISILFVFNVERYFLKKYFFFISSFPIFNFEVKWERGRLKEVLHFTQCNKNDDSDNSNSNSSTNNQQPTTNNEQQQQPTTNNQQPQQPQQPQQQQRTTTTNNEQQQRTTTTTTTTACPRQEEHY